MNFKGEVTEELIRSSSAEIREKVTSGVEEGGATGGTTQVQPKEEVNDAVVVAEERIRFSKAAEIRGRTEMTSILRIHERPEMRRYGRGRSGTPS